jgi:hypothetical protein
MPVSLSGKHKGLSLSISSKCRGTSLPATLVVVLVGLSSRQGICEIDRWTAIILYASISLQQTTQLSSVVLLSLKFKPEHSTGIQ